MMQLSDYYSLISDYLQFSRSGSSTFAKRIAGDFNPIHNVDAKRFCVPGDLLFAVLLDHYGVRQSMQLEFSGMVLESTKLALPPQTGEYFSLCDLQGKSYLQVALAGEEGHDSHFINELTLRYVQFSGRSFPNILVPLMRDKGVMINPERPLIIYKSMRIELQVLAGETITLTLKDADMEVLGKRGEVYLRFSISAAGVCIGHGEKHLSIRGLRDYDPSQTNAIVDGYMAAKSDYGAVC